MLNKYISGVVFLLSCAVLKEALFSEPGGDVEKKLSGACSYLSGGHWSGLESVSSGPVTKRESGRTGASNQAPSEAVTHLLSSPLLPSKVPVLTKPIGIC